MFKVGQKVWCAMLGEGVVTQILTSDTPFPVEVNFGDALDYYNQGGKYRSDAAQTLYPYPVEIVKKVTKPSINWEHVRGEYVFLAQDANGKAWLFREEPELDDYEDQWMTTLGGCHAAHTYISYTPGTCGWKDSLIARPKDA